MREKTTFRERKKDEVLEPEREKAQTIREHPEKTLLTTTNDEMAIQMQVNEKFLT